VKLAHLVSSVALVLGAVVAASCGDRSNGSIDMVDCGSGEQQPCTSGDSIACPCGGGNLVCSNGCFEPQSCEGICEPDAGVDADGQADGLGDVANESDADDASDAVGE
jgi:hypothetical protein